jgi:WD40 repeat protein
VIYDLAVSPKGDYLAYAEASNFSGPPRPDATATVHVLDMATFKEKYVLAENAFGMTYSASGALLATRGLDRIGLWEAATGKPIAFLPVPLFPRSIAFSRNGWNVAILCKTDDVKTKSMVVIWDLPKNQRRTITDLKEPIGSIAYSQTEKLWPAFAWMERFSVTQRQEKFFPVMSFTTALGPFRPAAKLL